MRIIDETDLHCYQGSSDKVYHLAITEDGGKYTCHAKWGARYSTLSSQAKVSNTNKAEAERVFQKFLAEKIKKGYVVSPGVSGPSVWPAEMRAKGDPIRKYAEKEADDALKESLTPTFGLG